MKKNTTLMMGIIALSASVALNVNAQLPKFAPNTYVSLSKKGMNSSAKVYQLGQTTDPTTGTFTMGATFSMGYNMNGIGLNSKDSLLYGASWTGENNTAANALNVNLYRMGTNGAYQDLGPLPVSGQNSIEFINFSAGTMHNGRYYYTSYGFTSTGAGKLIAATMFGVPLNLTPSDIIGYILWIDNVHLLTGATPAIVTGFATLNMNNPQINAAFQAYLNEINASYPNVYNADGGLQDIDINPATGMIYGYISYPNGGNIVGQPITFSLPSGGSSTITPVGSTVNTSPNKELAGLMFSNDAPNDLYALFTTGNFAKVDQTTGALVGMTMSNIPTDNVPNFGLNLRGDFARAFIPEVVQPVTLISFDAIKSNSKVGLNWTVTNEINLKAYEIQKSTDGKTWTTINTISAKNKAIGELNYSATDNNPFLGKNMYRLAQIDFDGSTAISKVITVIFESEATISVYPNPMSNVLNINAHADIQRIVVYDVTGKVRYSGKNTSQINTSDWAPGNYIIEFTEASGKKQSQKVLKY